MRSYKQFIRRVIIERECMKLTAMVGVSTMEYTMQYNTIVLDIAALMKCTHES